jgi:hypothetical protein
MMSAGVDDDEPVVAMQIIGGVFTSARGGPARSSGAASGSVLTLIVRRSTGRSPDILRFEPLRHDGAGVAIEDSDEGRLFASNATTRVPRGDSMGIDVVTFSRTARCGAAFRYLAGDRRARYSWTGVSRSPTARSWRETQAPIGVCRCAAVRIDNPALRYRGRRLPLGSSEGVELRHAVPTCDSAVDVGRPRRDDLQPPVVGDLVAVRSDADQT